jgi:hypothetical protein
MWKWISTGTCVKKIRKNPKINSKKRFYSAEKTRMELVACELDKIWPLEEIKSRQRSRDRNILEEDRNMVYFQAVANHKSRKKRVDALEDPNGLAKYHKRVMDIELL